MNDNTNYTPGDIANGYVLTEQNQWVPVPPAVVEPKKKSHKVRNSVLGIAAVCTVWGIAQSASGDDPKPVAKEHHLSLTKPSEWVSVPPLPTESAAPSEDQAAEAPTETTPPAPTKPAEPEMTLSQENAIESAKSYLDFDAFSRLGLIDQLSSEYGEGFTKADATFAVDHIKVDWNEQAFKSAKSYLDFDSFSRAGMIDQLTSSYGEQFTQAQALYAVNKLGL